MNASRAHRMPPHAPWRTFALACALAACATASWADKKPMSDADLASVAGQGVTVVVHLELNSGLLVGQPLDSRLTAGFTVDSVTTSVIAQNFGGILDMFAITLDPTARAGGADYLAIGLPTYFAADQFGVRAIGVQRDATGPLNGSLGSLMLNGVASMTGQLNLWPK